MIRRRDFLALTGAATLAGPLPAFAQVVPRKPLVAYLAITTPDAAADRSEPFRKAMKDLGWLEGVNYGLEIRTTNGINERLPGLTQELLALKPDVFVGEGSRGATAAAQATSTVPIVGPSMGEDVVLNLAGANFARPKGNVTGVLFTAVSNIGKQFELAAEMIPMAKRFGLLSDTFVANDLSTTEVTAAVAALGITLVRVQAASPSDLPAAVQKLVEERADLVISNGALFNSEQQQLIALVALAKLPAIYAYAASVPVGGPAAYGSDLTYNYRRAAGYVDRILKGAKPSDMPIDVPSPVLAINLKTAKALGLTIAASVLARADQIVE